MGRLRTERDALGSQVSQLHSSLTKTQKDSEQRDNNQKKEIKMLQGDIETHKYQVLMQLFFLGSFQQGKARLGSFRLVAKNPPFALICTVCSFPSQKKHVCALCTKFRYHCSVNLRQPKIFWISRIPYFFSYVSDWFHFSVLWMMVFTHRNIMLMMIQLPITFLSLFKSF